MTRYNELFSPRTIHPVNRSKKELRVGILGPKAMSLPNDSSLMTICHSIPIVPKLSNFTQS